MTIDKVQVHWPTAISKLVASGYTQAEIGASCGLTQGSISDLLRGRNSEPRYSAGAAILQLMVDAGVDVSSVHCRVSAPQATPEALSVVSA